MTTQSHMRCHEATRYLSAFADGELAEPLRSLVGAHVADCQRCAAEVARVRQTDVLLRAIPRTAPSPRVFHDVLDAIQAEADPQAHRESIRKQQRSDTLRRRLSAIAAPSRAPIPLPVRHRSRRARVLAGAIPTVAAVLLISISVIAFTHAHMRPRTSTTNLPAPIRTTVATVLERTTQQVRDAQKQLAFTAALPSYLPPGARLSAVTTTPLPTAGQGVSPTYLDVTWNFSGGPVCQMHLREAPKSLGWVGYTAGGANALLSWQLVNKPAWRPLNPLVSSREPAVGQDRGQLTIALDASPCSPTDTSDNDIAILRLVSLSMDASYQPLTITPTNTAGRVSHFTQVVTDGHGATRYTRDVYTSADASEQAISLSSPNGAQLSETIIHGQRALQLDIAHKSYFTGNLSAVGGPAATPDTQARLVFYSANTLASEGYLWNIGLSTYHGAQVYALALVTGPAPAMVYVDATSHQAIAMRVNTTSTTQPGGPDATPWFSAQPCGTYRLIEYLAQAPAGTFTQQAPSDYRPGPALPTPGCPA